MHTDIFYAQLLTEARTNLNTIIPGVMRNHPARAAKEAIDAANAFLSQHDFWTAIDRLGGVQTVQERLEAALMA